MNEYFYQLLIEGIQTMTPDSRLYKTLKRELKARGLWKKDKPRGKPFVKGDKRIKPRF